MLSISYQHIIIACLAIIPFFFAAVYDLYRLIKYSVKKGVQESREK